MGNCKSSDTRQSTVKQTMAGTLSDMPGEENSFPREEEEQDSKQVVLIFPLDDDEHAVITRHVGMVSPQTSTAYDYPDSPAMGLRSNTAFLPTPMVPAGASYWPTSVHTENDEYHANNNNNNPRHSSSSSSAMGKEQAVGVDDPVNNHNMRLPHNNSSSSCHSSVGAPNHGDGDGTAEFGDEAALRRKASLVTVREWFACTQTLSQEELVLLPATD